MKEKKTQTDKDVIDNPRKHLEAFINEHKKRILNVIYRYIKSEDDAKDIFQDACMTMFTNIESGKLDDMSAKLSTYLTQICINQSLKKIRDNRNTTFDNQYLNDELYNLYGVKDEKWRKGGKTKEEIIDELVKNLNRKVAKRQVFNIGSENFSVEKVDELLTMSEDTAFTERQIEMLHQILNDLPEPCDKILWSYYGEEKSMAEIAQIVDYKNASVAKVMKKRCWDKLNARIKNNVKK